MPKFNATPLVVTGLVAAGAVVGWTLWRRSRTEAAGGAGTPLPVADVLAPLINTGHLVLVSSFNYDTGLSEAFVPNLPGNVLTEIRPHSVLIINMSVAHTVIVSGNPFPIMAGIPTPVPVEAAVTITVL